MYYLIYGILWLISLLPLRVLYLISDGVYGLAFYIIKYRKKIVLNNLRIAFPEKTEEERNRIAKKFYRNLTDYFIETLKMLSASGKFFEKRFVGNWDVINEVKATGRSVQMHIGHTFNWEWGNIQTARKVAMPLIGVYMPVTNKVFDRLLYNLRTGKGTIMIRATHMKEDFMPYRHMQYLLGLVADQNPGNPAKGWWFNFLGKPAPFVKGPAQGALTNNCAVVFAYIKKVKRGYYEAVFSGQPTEGLTEKELTGKFVRFLEDVIRKRPDMWLWSHRRWKHEWKEVYGTVSE